MSHGEQCVRMKRVTPEGTQEVRVPPQKARRYGITHAGARPVTVAYLMEGLSVWSESIGDHSVRCPNCGTTRREFSLYQRAGCAHCYETFSRSIDRVLSRTSPVTLHRGRIPKRLQRYRSIFVEREALLLELREAVAMEDFERGRFTP